MPPTKGARDEEVLAPAAGAPAKAPHVSVHELCTPAAARGTRDRRGCGGGANVRGSLKPSRQRMWRWCSSLLLSRAEQTDPQQVELGVRDLLVLPPYWVHLVQATTMSVSVNSWISAASQGVLQTVYQEVPLPFEEDWSAEEVTLRALRDPYDGDATHSSLSPAALRRSGIPVCDADESWVRGRIRRLRANTAPALCGAGSCRTGAQ
eukprot:scaffold1102_cov256-Pinguiococcus_pyrenoidosus.AAC.50